VSWAASPVARPGDLPEGKWGLGLPALLTDQPELINSAGHAARLRLLQRLRGGEQCVCDLTEELESRQSLLSFHLRTLKDAGLVTDRRDGRWVYYAINPDGLEALRRALDELRPASRSLRVLRRCD